MFENASQTVYKAEQSVGGLFFHRNSFVALWTSLETRATSPIEFDGLTEHLKTAVVILKAGPVYIFLSTCYVG